MRKVVIGNKPVKKFVDKKIISLDAPKNETPPMRLNKHHERVANDFSQLQELNSFTDIQYLFLQTLNQKGRQNIQSHLRKIRNSLVDFAKELDEIGIGTFSSKIRKEMIPSINELAEDVNHITSKEFINRFNHLKKSFNDFDPNIPQSDIKELFNTVLSQKKKSFVEDTLNQLLRSLKLFVKELEHVGRDSTANTIKRGFIPSLKVLIKEVPNIKFKEFKERFLSLRNSFFESVKINLPSNQKIEYFDSMPDIMNNIKKVSINLPNSTPAQMMTIPIVIHLYKKLSDMSKAIMERNLKARFVPYTGAMILDKALFLVINRDKFGRTNIKTVASSILKALAKEGKDFVPIFDISKELENYFIVFVTKQEYLRPLMDVVDAKKDVVYYLK